MIRLDLASSTNRRLTADPLLFITVIFFQQLFWCHSPPQPELYSAPQMAAPSAPSLPQPPAPSTADPGLDADGDKSSKKKKKKDVRCFYMSVRLFFFYSFI